MLQDNRLAWRRVYKSLILLHTLLKSGSERVVSNARDHLFDLRSLENYKCTDERGRDQGVNIRHRVKQVIELLQDDDLLAEERRKTKAESKEKYQGFSREDLMMKGALRFEFFAAIMCDIAAAVFQAAKCRVSIIGTKTSIKVARKTLICRKRRRVQTKCRSSFCLQ